MKEKQQHLVKSDHWQEHSQKLIQCLVNLENPEQRTDAKMELVMQTSKLMPNGNPCFREVIHFPTITSLINQHGRKTVMKLVLVLVGDFCSSLNVVRNMTEEQMIEATGMLIDESDNFRIEDYVMMFALGKRGQLVKIRDRIDISLIGEMLDLYHEKRTLAGRRIQEEEFVKKENQWNQKQVPDPESEEEMEMSERFGRLAGIMSAWKEEDEAALEADKGKERMKQAENYAKLHDVNIEKILDEFGKKKNVRPNKC